MRDFGSGKFCRSSFHTVTIVIWALGAAWLSIHPAFAAKFANQFVEFEAPPQFECKLDGAEWVCQSLEEPKRKDAIIVFAAKLKGEQDSLDAYSAYLKKPKSFTSTAGKPVTSEQKYTRITDLAGQAWVDSLHLDSEIPGYYTRYLATVHQDIGVLVTYSIHKAKYQDYSKDFEAMVKTLKVFRKTGGINTSAGSLFNTVQIPNNVNSIYDAETPKGSDQSPGDGKPQTVQAVDDTWLYIGFGAVLLLYFYYRRRRS